MVVQENLIMCGSDENKKGEIKNKTKIIITAISRWKTIIFFYIITARII